MRRLWIVAWALSAGLAWAQPVLNPATAPGLDAAGRASYADWLLTSTPRVFALGSNGKMGWYSGGKTLEEARGRAIQLCTEHGGTACQPYAEDLSVVWPGRAWRPAAPPGPLVDTMNYGFVPDQRFLWHGPLAARGVVVWSIGTAPSYFSHGAASTGADLSGIDLRGLQPPPYLRAFNDAGFDVIRFDRAPLVDNPVRTLGWLRDELPALRQSGYRTVVAAGDSRGAWTSLQLLATPGLADVVIAVAPAAHGSGASLNLSAQNDDLRMLIAEAAPSRTRVAIAQFTADPFISDAGVYSRLLQGLQAKTGGLLLIDRPPGLTGHAGGIGSAFARRFGPCLLLFATAPVPPTACSAAE